MSEGSGIADGVDCGMVGGSDVAVGTNVDAVGVGNKCDDVGVGMNLDVEGGVRARLSKSQIAFINKHCGIELDNDQIDFIDRQGKEEDLNEDPTNLCLGSSNEVVFNWIPEVDASNEDTDDDMLDLVHSSESEAEDDGYLDDLGSKTIVHDEGRLTHRVICSHGTVRSNYMCGSCGKWQTCCSKTFVPCCDDAFCEDVIHFVHPGNAVCDGAF